MTEQTGPIVACSTSRELGSERFAFEDLGELEVRGRDGRERLGALATGAEIDSRCAATAVRLR